MKQITVENILRVTGGVLSGGPAPEGELTAVTTDSRAVTPGCLFAAIRGERNDGHDYIGAALAGGAVCCLGERGVAGVPGPVIVVPDTVRALQQISGFYRAQFQIPILGVTGSVGKTTAKEMTAAVLGQRLCVHKTAGNFNNDLGVPLTLLGLGEDHEAAVVELGISHPGDMARIAAIARPTMALYTVIGYAHLEFLGSLEGVFREKTVLNQFLPPDGPVFCNGDDPFLAAMAKARPNTVTFGMGPDCDVRAEQVRPLPDVGSACVIRAGERRFPVEIPAFGEHMIYAALEGAAVGLELGLTEAEIQKGIAAYVPVGSRGQRLELGSVVVIDDCYNANPTSTCSALRSLAMEPGAGRRVCILGDMLELGPDSRKLHRFVGAEANRLGLDLALTAGTGAEAIAEGAGEIARHFPDRESLVACLGELIRPGDTVLVKASRSMGFEAITEALKGLFP